MAGGATSSEQFIVIVLALLCGLMCVKRDSSAKGGMAWDGGGGGGGGARPMFCGVERDGSVGRRRVVNFFLISIILFLVGVVVGMEVEVGQNRAIMW